MGRQKLCRAVLVATAIAFVISCWLYGIATLRITAAVSAAGAAKPVERVTVFFGDHGTALLAIELLVMAVAVVGLLVGERSSVERQPR